MSWWPFSGSGSSSNASAQTQSSQPLTTSSSTTSHPPLPPTSAPHDPDFYAAHPHLAPPSLPSNRTDPTALQPESTDQEFDPTLPRTMSCRAAFDSAFYCSSLGGHFNDIYRHGQLRSCSDHWNDFWFCMRVKNSYSGQDVKERLVQERYQEKENKVKSGPNSEDIWVKRASSEEIVGAFGVRYEAER